MLSLTKQLFSVPTVMSVVILYLLSHVSGLVSNYVDSNTDQTAWWAEQDRRQSQIQTVCEKYRNDIPHGLGFWGLETFSYSETYNLLFCRNQKVGSSAWLVQNFRYFLGLTKEDLERLDISNWYNWTKDKFKVEDEEELRLLFEKAISFSVVRHPFERLVSAFQDKIMKEESYLAENFKLDYGKPTFAKFVNHVINDAEKDSFDIHWEPFISACSYCYFKYTIISKLETMEEDRKIILAMVDAQVPERKKIQNKTSGENIEKVTKDFFSQLTSEEGEALANIYKYDLEMFGYDADKYLGMTKKSY